MRGEIIPNILRFSIDKITGEKLDDTRLQTCFLKNKRKEVVIEGRE